MFQKIPLNLKQQAKYKQLVLKKLMAPPPPNPPSKNQRIRGARVAWAPKKSKCHICILSNHNV